MTLKQWLENGWIRSHQTSSQEIANLLNIVRRDLSDARSNDVSDDWRFGIAHNAALKLCTILLYSEGFRPIQGLAHFRTIQALPLILGNERISDAAYLETCRIKRNHVEYDYVGGATKADADELIEFAVALQKDVLAWLKTRHAHLVPNLTGSKKARTG